MADDPQTGPGDPPEEPRDEEPRDEEPRDQEPRDQEPRDERQEGAGQEPEGTGPGGAAFGSGLPFGGGLSFGGAMPFGPFGGPGGFDFAQIARMLQSEGPVNWEVARQTAGWVAAGDVTTAATRPDPPVDDETRREILELVQVAVTQVVGATGLSGSFASRCEVVGPQAWAEQQLGALRPVLEAFATSLEAELGDDDPDDSTPADTEPGADPFGLGAFGGLAGFGGADPFGGMMRVLAPALLGVQAGSMVGFLAQHCLGRYDLPLPLDGEPSLVFVARNLDTFQAAWELDRTDTRLYVALHEVVHAAVRSVPWVRERLVNLALEYVGEYRIDPNAVENQFEGFDPMDPSTFSAATANPIELLGAIRGPGQQDVLTRLRTFTAVLEGYADTVLEHVGRPLVTTFDRIHEAVARHRLERGEAGQFIEGLLGIDLRREDYERGRTFARGVMERSGIAGLNRLWEDARMLPTPAEVDAPGLWLARLDVMDD